MAEYQLPDVGEGLTEAEIVTWKVKVGDVVKVNDIVVEIETAKSLVELPSPYAGTVTALLVAEGETVAGRHADHRDRRPSAVAERRPRHPPVPATRWRSTCPTRRPAAAARARPWSGRTKADRGPARRAAPGGPRRPASRRQRPRPRCRCRARFAPGGAQSQPVVEADEPAVPATSAPVRRRLRTPADVRVLAKPPVRKLAKDLGVDLATLTPTGPDGTVTPRGRRGGRRGRSHGRAPAVQRAPDARERPGRARPASRSRACAR